jgi:putative N6-adenine-specific DNA methylase
LSVFNLKSTIRVNCAKRCGIYLKKEIEALGYKIDSDTDSSVEITGTLVDCMRLNLYLRTAFRVLFLIDQFEAANPDVLYDHLVAIPWEEYVIPEGYISISSFVENNYIKDTRFANLKVKDAVVDRMQQKTKKRPDSGPDTDKMVLYLYWKNEDAIIFIDTSGDTIAKHGYRNRSVKAPMQEALAAAVIMATSWDHNSSFINPMCGSGTLAIEAALIASNKAPGLMRHTYGFSWIKGFDEETWKEMRQEAARQIKRNLVFPIIASDNDPVAIQASLSNARSARVDHLIRFETCDFEETAIPDRQKGIVIMNPEYGERMGEAEILEETYGFIGDFFKKKCKGYLGYIFTGNMDLSKKVGLKAKRRIEFFNAKIDCRLLEYELYEGTKVVPKEISL